MSFGFNGIIATQFINTTTSTSISLNGCIDRAVVDTLVSVNATSGDLTITLPPLGNCTGFKFRISKTDSSGNTVTINTPDGSTINGASSFVLSIQGQSADIESDTTQFIVYGSNNIPSLTTIESEIATLTTNAGQYRKFHFTASSLIALVTSPASNTTATVDLAAGLFTSGSSKITKAWINVTTGETGTSTATLTLGTTGAGYTDLLTATDLTVVAATGSSTGLYLAGGTDLKGVLTVTGSGKHISDIASLVFDVYVDFALPH